MTRARAARGTLQPNEEPRRRMRSPCCACAVSGHTAAAPPNIVMKSRRFTALCFPCFDRKDSTPRVRQVAAALRHFNPAHVAVGSSPDLCFRVGMSAYAKCGHRLPGSFLPGGFWMPAASPEKQPRALGCFIAVHLPSGAAQACEFRCLGPSRHLPPSSRKEPSPDISGVQPKSSTSQFLDIMSLEEVGLRHC